MNKITFTQFLSEEQFSEDDISRILSVMERRLPKLLGFKLYRHGGSKGIVKGNSFTAVLYYFGDRAFQIRMKGTKVVSIDVWDKFAINRGPSYTIDISKLDAGSILASITKLADLILHPSEGKVPADIVNESVQLDEMAKRVSDIDFYNFIVAAFGEDRAKSVSWDQIKQVADANDVLIPGYIRSQKIGRGIWDATPKSSEPSEEAPKEKMAKPAKESPVLYIKVTAQDPETKKFISTADSKEAQQLYGQIQTALAAPPSKAELKDPETLYGHMAQLVDMIAKKQLRSLIINGGPGSGKTHTIMQVIEQNNLLKNKDYVKLSGKASPIEIYKTLFMFRDGGLIVFDDLDSMWRNEDATNILKAALDSSPVREISWVSTQTINVSRMPDDKKQELFKQIDRQIDGTDEEVDVFPGDDDSDEDSPKKAVKKRGADTKIRYPSTFDFKGRVIFISNLKPEEMDSAILSRSTKINMDLSPEQILMRMKAILPTLGGTDVSLEKKQELLDQLVAMHGRKEITMVTMREFTKGLDIVRSGAPNWRDLLIYM